METLPEVKSDLSRWQVELAQKLKKAQGLTTQETSSLMSFLTPSVRLLKPTEIRQIVMTCHDLEPTGTGGEFERVTDIIVDYILESHQQKACGEFVRAFQMNLYGELDSRVSSYGRWSLSYFSQVMIEWEMYRSKLLMTLERKQPVEENVQGVASAGQMYQATIKYANEHGEWPLIWPWEKIYDYMESIGLINLQPKEKIAIFDFIKSTSGKWRGENHQDYLDRMKRESKERMVKKYILPDGSKIKEPKDIFTKA